MNPYATDEARWQAVLSRDARADGRFVFAVSSTGVYCRPSCPARRPRRQNARFFATPADARAAGYRACRRCEPDADITEPQRLLEQARALIEASEMPLTLAELGTAVGLSPGHLQRTFMARFGVSPAQYGRAHRAGRLRDALTEGEAVTDALYGAGYRSSRALYGEADRRLGMTPGRYRNGAPATEIAYEVVETALGPLLIAATERGLCAVRFGGDEATLVSALGEEFPKAHLTRDGALLAEAAQQLLAYLVGEQAALDLPLDVQATAFQARVWQALRAIPYGERRSYRQVAEAIGQPNAARAVAGACAANPVALVIPCHRVVRRNGESGGYRWGTERKAQLLAREGGATASLGGH